MTTTAQPTPVLSPGVIYGAHDRYVCIDCAGMTATYTGYTIGGAPVEQITNGEVREWATYDLGPLRCEGGHLEAVAHGSNHARPNFIEVPR